MTKFDAKAIAAAQETLTTNFETRKQHEIEKNASNASMQKSLNKMIDKQINQATALFLLQNDVDLNFINSNKIKSNRYNEKAAVKVFDLIDHINIDLYSRHLLLAMRALEDENILMTDELALDALRTVKTKQSKVKALDAVRMNEIKSESTISTQKSSSLRAMLTVKLIRVEKNDANKTVYRLNKSNAHVKKLFASFDKQLENAA